MNAAFDTAANPASPDFSSLRNDILKKYPDLDPQKKFPLQIVWFLALAAIIVFTSVALIRALNAHGSTLAIVLESLALGVLWGSISLFSHELLHGSIITDGPILRAFAFFGFFIFGLSPALWTAWHNRVHHYHTNRSGIDPDSFGLWEDFKKLPMIDLLLKRAPGSRHPLSWVYLALNFSNQTMNIMWFVLWKGDAKFYESSRKPALIETLVQYALWILFFVILGWKAGLLVLVVPSLIANLITSSYILVQHLFCPLTDSNQPLENTLGVTTLKPLDWIHFNFSHHIEHHVFPEMNHVQLPKVRAILRKEYPSFYRVMSHRKAIRILLQGPRIYKDAQTLWDPYSHRELSVSQMGKNPA